MTLEIADVETLQQHVDALNILINLIFSEMAESHPGSLRCILQQLRHALDTTPQLHPILREQLEVRFTTFTAHMAGTGTAH